MCKCKKDNTRIVSEESYYTKNRTTIVLAYGNNIQNTKLTVNNKLETGWLFDTYGVIIVESGNERKIFIDMLVCHIGMIPLLLT